VRVLAALGTNACAAFSFQGMCVITQSLSTLRLHYDEVVGKSVPEKRRKHGSVFASVAYAHRKQLNQKLILPRRVKEILRKPADEERWDKMRLLCEAVRSEIEREEDVFLNSEADIEKLALAVEACRSEVFGDEVGPGFEPIPPGCRLQLGEQSEGTSVQDLRKETASLVRSMQVDKAVSVKFRPMGTSRQPPMDNFSKKLMKYGFKEVAEGLSVQEMRDLLLIALWDALFLTASEHWTQQKVANTCAVDAHELGWWFWQGQEIGREPLFHGICVPASDRISCSNAFFHVCCAACFTLRSEAQCGCLLHQFYVHGVSNTCYGPPMNRDGELLRSPTGAPLTESQPPFLSSA